MKLKRLLLAAVLSSQACFLAACNTTGNHSATAPTMPERFSMPQTAALQTDPAEGSLYSEQSMNLFKDNRASKVGDILLVEIVETSNAKKNATTKTERSSNVAAGISQFFGFEKWLEGNNSNFTASDKNLEVDLVNDFEGKGQTARNSTISATLSARVVDVTMEGNLVIQGYREIRVNNEVQFLMLSGLVRPGDISPRNSIKSSYIADARIDYSGTGAISDKQQPGWLARGIDILWPF